MIHLFSLLYWSYVIHDVIDSVDLLLMHFRLWCLKIQVHFQLEITGRASLPFGMTPHVAVLFDWEEQKQMI